MELLNNCRDYAHKFYSSLLVSAEQTLADVLFEHSEQSMNSDEQRQYYEARQQLENRGGALESEFHQELGKAFHAFSKGQDQEESLDEKFNVNNLSLVQRDELEDKLAISVIVSKANSRYSEQLWKLNRRMAVLRGGKTVTDETNPFGPQMIFQALQTAVRQLDLDSKAKMLVYKELGKLFIAGFAKALDELNEQLVDKGILPNLRFSVIKAAEEAAMVAGAGHELPQAGEVSGEQEYAASVAHQQQIYDAIRALQAAVGPRTHTTGGVSFEGLVAEAGEQSGTFSALDYALALSAIQQSKDVLHATSLGRPVPAGMVEEQLVGHLRKHAKEDERHKVARGDADTIDVVGMIFRYILDDEALADSVKSLLSHLHTPYLKLALMDSSFLDNGSHNARRLLDYMADVGGRWVKDESDRTVLPKLKSIVDTILNDFIDDASLFDRLLEDFVRFREGLEKRAQMVEMRNTEAQQGLEKLEVSKTRAEAEFRSRMEGKNIPDTARMLIEKPWVEFLSFNLLRHGEESSSWQSALKVVDGIIWSLQPDSATDNKEDFQRRHEDLERFVEEGLSTIGYDEGASRGLIHTLKDAQALVYHSVVSDGVASHLSEDERKDDVEKSAVRRQREAMAVAQSEVVADEGIEPLSAAEEALVEKLKNIGFGTWFEFDRDEKITEVLKLAWYSKVTSHYMFVNYAGVKQGVETQKSLARGMHNGTIRVAKIDKRSFMERALGAVLKTLRPSEQ